MVHPGLCGDAKNTLGAKKVSHIMTFHKIRSKPARQTGYSGMIGISSGVMSSISNHPLKKKSMDEVMALCIQQNLYLAISCIMCQCLHFLCYCCHQLPSTVLLHLNVSTFSVHFTIENCQSTKLNCKKNHYPIGYTSYQPLQSQRTG